MSRGLRWLTAKLRGASGPMRRNAIVGFTDVTREVGIQIEDAPWGTYGAAWGDYDNDGNPDLFICRHAVAPVLYRNTGRGTFIDVTESSGLLAGIRRENLFLLDRHGCAWGEANSDGYLDLYCSMGARDGKGANANQLFRNNGDGTFADMARAAGVEDPNGRGRDVHWIDYDNDGDLDLFVSNARRAGFPSRLFRNDGQSFTDVTFEAGLGDEVDILGGGASWCDYNGDGNIDLLLGSYEGLILRRNLGDGRFAPDCAREVGLVATKVRSASWGDFDNDGYQDLFVTCTGELARLYRNRGDGTFTDVTAQSGINAPDSVAGVWGDFNNDGYLDLFVVRGHRKRDGRNLSNLLYLNNGDGTFTETAEAAGVRGPATGAGDSAAIADYDNDGCLDIVVTHSGLQVDEVDGPVLAPLSGDAFPPGRIETYRPADCPVSLYRNNGNENHWLVVRLEGRPGNSRALGAKVWLSAGGNMQYREVGDGVVQYGQSDRIVHFGLGPVTQIDELKIRWPSGGSLLLSNVRIDEVVRISQAESAS
jgi:hypothetical protein